MSKSTRKRTSKSSTNDFTEIEEIIKKPLTAEEQKFREQNKLYKYKIDEAGDLRNPMDHIIVDWWNQNLGIPEDKLIKQSILPRIGTEKEQAEARRR